MRRELENEIYTRLAPYLKEDRVEDAKLVLTMVLGKYDIQKTETSLVVYEGDINEQIVKRFLMAKVARGCTPRTVNYYKNEVGKILEVLGKPYSEVTADDMRLYLAKRIHVDGVSKTTANNERRAMSAFYFWLAKEEILIHNPFNKVEPIKEAKKKKKAFEQMEIEQMRDACRTAMESALLEALISTWARVSEIAMVRIDDIQENSIIVHGKGEKDREVFLTPRAKLAISKYLAERKDTNPYLFPKSRYAGNVQAFLHGAGQKGTARAKMCEWYKEPELVGEGHRGSSTIESTIRAIGKRAHVQNAHPHRFRRTGATMALRAGMPLIKVSKLLGHENIGTTQIYLDISDKELEQAHEKYVI